MSDLFQLSNLEAADFNSGTGPGDPSQLKTGDLRRKYNFGDRVSELAIPQDPFFRFVSKVGKKPTDDPQFKWTEKRDSWHKRYAYPVAVYNSSNAWVETAALGADLTNSNFSTFKIRMATDYKSNGNIQNVFGNTTGNNITVGASGTQPAFYLPNQLVKINVATAVPASIGAAVASDYAVLKVSKVTTIDAAGSANSGALGANQCDMVELEGTIVKDASSGMDSLTVPASFGGDTVAATTIGASQTGSLEVGRSYIVGTSHDEGSGYPETWKDQPYSTNYGRTQIWKTSMAMTNTARATVLKYDQNEWARVWKDKLVEHKWDIENSLLFGAQSDSNYTTQGVVDYISTYGNLFSLDTATKTADDFLDDMSNYLDPRYNNSTANVFFVSTAVYNWLHKLGGYFKNNLEISPNFRADFAMTGKKKILGIDITTFSTPYGDMNVARNIHLDGSNIKMLGINMKYASYRPLIGNGVNRDTSVYVGVQTLENSGIDRRVDLILTEAGLELSMPECHALWS